jgi:hypothetical protein
MGEPAISVREATKLPKERRGLVVWSGPPPSGPLRRDARRMGGNE